MSSSQRNGLRIEEICPSRMERVVSIEISGDGEAELFIRGEDSALTRLKEPFSPFEPIAKLPFKRIASPMAGSNAGHKTGVPKAILQLAPFILLERPETLPDTPGHVSRLAPPSCPGRHLAAIAKFAGVEEYGKAVSSLKKSSGFTATAPNAPYRTFGDMVQQFLISSQIRLFRGMTFREIRRMQFDIETLLTKGYDFPNPERPDDKIAMICMKDSSGWERAIILDESNGGERRLLEEFVEAVKERDPDVIEGYNIFRFDLPFIEKRAAMHGVKLPLGRDGSKLRSRASRTSFAERTINYTRYEAYGRHFADIYFMVQLYDISHRDLEDFNLKSVARHLGVAAKNRTYVEHDDISALFKSDPGRLAAYCMDDVRETDSISLILSPSYFYQTQIVPLSYQNCIVRGNATKIDAMLVSNYVVGGRSIPYPEQARSFEGALTDAFESGVFENVWHCDIRSLYPSILLAGAKGPARDSAGVFLGLLGKLRDFRLFAKDQAKKEKNNEKREFFDALQSIFKILINSFYGYLGFAQGAFNDYSLAAAVTATGRQILGSMTDFLRKSGAKVIEIDTDGIYFQPPESLSSPIEMQERIQGMLPEGIDVELDNVYTAMFCYKSKNYALLHKNGGLSMTGAALKSRGLEPFQREYMGEMVGKLLKRDYQGIAELNERYEKGIRERSFPLAKFAKTETLQDSPETYSRKLQDGSGRRSAAYELAIRAGRQYKQGDQISYYITGTKRKVSVVDNSRLLRDAPAQRDDNVEYYLAKFEELEEKFSAFIPQDLKKMKQEDDLFV